MAYEQTPFGVTQFGVSVVVKFKFTQNASALALALALREHAVSWEGGGGEDPRLSHFSPLSTEPVL